MHCDCSTFSLLHSIFTMEHISLFCNGHLHRSIRIILQLFSIQIEIRSALDRRHFEENFTNPLHHTYFNLGTCFRKSGVRWVVDLSGSLVRGLPRVSIGGVRSSDRSTHLCTAQGHRKGPLLALFRIFGLFAAFFRCGSPFLLRHPFVAGYSPSGRPARLYR